MKNKLNQKQRILTSLCYVLTILIVYYFANRNFLILDQNENISIWFYSGILLIIMGKYVTEPYFTTPTDVLSNGIAIFLLLIQNNQNRIIGSNVLIFLSLILIIVSLLNIFTPKNSKINILSYYFSKFFGKSVFLYSLVFISSTATYFGGEDYLYSYGPSMLFISLALWLMIVIFDTYSIVISELSKYFDILTSHQRVDNFGKIVEDRSEFQLLEVPRVNINDYELESMQTEYIVILKLSNDAYSVNMISDLMEMSQNVFIKIKPIKLENRNGIHINDIKKSLNVTRLDDNIGDNYLMKIDGLPLNIKNIVYEYEYFIKNSEYIGKVQIKSDINKVYFSIFNNQSKLTEGSIVNVKINEDNVLYQVINGFTQEDFLVKNSNFGYIQGVARKIGVYDEDNNELKSINWTPNMNESVYLNKPQPNTTDLKNIANVGIGRLPKTNMAIPLKDIDSLVTHNTAILGVLGVGKSYLTFELIKRIIDNNTKVICIDITNQYASDDGLPLYVGKTNIQNDFKDKHHDRLNTASASNIEDKNTPSSWGNIVEYRKILREFISHLLNQEDKKVLIFNPNTHNVFKADKQFNITESVPVSLVEKTKIISEELLSVMMEKGMSDKAECCIVFEESHSLTPEWNSIVFKGDDEHSNGISKVILQGRKFGMGCILVTQRTANVTKNILNQCNTIFAMRIFDETGKSFLENYIGKDYSSILPSLEERHAVVSGKGLGIKQPVVIELNDAKYIQTIVETD
ncbi:ATP-binding protein [Erysipelothrix rhusiopathiae]|uniref:ATP-binding protein n=1 Tax=Erysipelothrix rhusiopathiae TaxID=1648 RepID=UPI0024801201|nr:DUF87 domain-containing protein [Erysipelothrix rhusiopathiae]